MAQDPRNRTSLPAKASAPKLPSLPIPIDRQLDIEISAALNGIVGTEETGFAMFEDRRPASVVLGRLKDRLKDLSMRPAMDFPEEIINKLQEMFSVMGSRTGDSQMRAKVYIDNLMDLPGAALCTVIRRYIRGELGDSDFAPSIAHLRQSTDRLTDRLDKERDRIVKVLEFWGTENANGRPHTLIPAKEGQGAARGVDRGNESTQGSNAPGGSRQAEDRS